MIITAKAKHIIVFKVNIDSPRKHQVNIGNNIRPVEEPINLAAQTESVACTTDLQAYQKAIEVGTPKTNAATNGLSFHQSDKYWEFN